MRKAQIKESEFFTDLGSEEELGITFFSEPSLADDWDKPEEDEAWRFIKDSGFSQNSQKPVFPLLF